MQQNSTELIAGCINSLGSISLIRLDYSSLTWTGKKIIFTIGSSHIKFVENSVTVLWKRCGWNHKKNNRSLVSAVLQSAMQPKASGKQCIYILMITNMQMHLLRTQLFTACTNQMIHCIWFLFEMLIFLLLNSCPLLAREWCSNITLCLRTFFLTQLNHISKHVTFSSVYFLFQKQRGVNMSSTRPAACSAVNAFNYCQRHSPGFRFALFFCYLSCVLCSLRARLNYTRRLDVTVTLPLVSGFPVSDGDASLS